VNVILTPELEKLIQAKVESGQFESRDAVVQAALELFREQEAAQDRLDALLDEAEGEGIELTAEARSALENRAVRALRERKPA
jgi:putative addiction module CopG family antidote